MPRKEQDGPSPRGAHSPQQRRERKAERGGRPHGQPAELQHDEGCCLLLALGSLVITENISPDPLSLDNL